MACNGLIPLVCAPQWSRIIVGKTHFWPIFDLFLVPKQPIFRAFRDFGGAKMACQGLKKGSFHLFRHPKRSGITFGETHF